MSTRARVFVGVDLDLTVCEKLVLVQEDLLPIVRDRQAKVRWVPAPNLHLTLKFIGETEDAMIHRIRDVLNAIAAEQDPFSLVLSGVGAFPDAKKPRILYAASTKGTEDVKALAGAVESALVDIGLPAETRAYSPHVTLGRVKTPSRRLDVSDVVEALGELPLGTTEIRDLILFKTHMGTRGAHYEVVSRHRFRGVHPNIG